VVLLLRSHCLFTCPIDAIHSSRTVPRFQRSLLPSYRHGHRLVSPRGSLSYWPDYYTPLYPTTCNNPIGQHHITETFHRTHFSLYKLRNGARGFLLGSWTLMIGPVDFSETSVRNSTICCVITQKSAVLRFTDWDLRFSRTWPWRFWLWKRQDHRPVATLSSSRWFNGKS
jgi:hypothetical protein